MPLHCSFFKRLRKTISWFWRCIYGASAPLVTLQRGSELICYSLNKLTWPAHYRNTERTFATAFLHLSSFAVSFDCSTEANIHVHKNIQKETAREREGRLSFKDEPPWQGSKKILLKLSSSVVYTETYLFLVDTWDLKVVHSWRFGLPPPYGRVSCRYRLPVPSYCIAVPFKIPFKRISSRIMGLRLMLLPA